MRSDGSRYYCASRFVLLYLFRATRHTATFGLVGGRLTRTERAPFVGDEGDGLSGTGRGDRFRIIDLSFREPNRTEPFVFCKLHTVY